MRFVKKGKYVLIIGFLAILSLFLFIIVNLFIPPHLSRLPQENFIVRNDYSQENIVNKLWKNHFLRNKKIFIFLLKHRGVSISPGGYFISRSMSPWQITNILAGPPQEIWVRIPDGLRKEQIYPLLQKKFQWRPETENDFLKMSEEGYLFPETYLFDRNSSPKMVIQRLNNQLQKEFSPLSESNSEESKTIILASLIQREAESEEDMKIVSSIIYNRSKLSMPLDIDATLQYIIGNSQDWWPPITNETKKINSPFNTYTHNGLPPSPICNPGLKAIKAALSPAKTNYLYYLYDHQGKIHCARTYKEHLQNIKNFLRNNSKS